jgi:hypothetical protein
MIERFLYHAFATGADGQITAPFQEIIPIQASCALSGNAGFGSSRVEGFRFHDIVSFASAHAVVAGSYSEEKKSFSSIATVTVEDLDVLGVVRADRIVCRVASSHPNDPDNPDKPRSITFIGSHFDNLKIAGYPLKVDLAMNRFGKLGTLAGLRDAYSAKNNEEMKRDPKRKPFYDEFNGFQDEFNRTCMVGHDKDDMPPQVKKYLPWAGWDPKAGIPQRNGMISGSLVRNVEGLGSEVALYGHIIHVKGFGTIRLAEFHITDTERHLSMLQLNLGCSPDGDLGFATGAGNGTGW